MMTVVTKNSLKPELPFYVLKLKDSTNGGAQPKTVRPPLVEAASCRLIYGWVCGGWTGSKHTKNIDPWQRQAVGLGQRVIQRCWF